MQCRSGDAGVSFRGCVECQLDYPPTCIILHTQRGMTLLKVIHLPVILFRLWPKYLPHTPNVCSSPNMRAQVYLLCKPRVKLIVLYILILMFSDIKREDMGFGTAW